MVVAKQMFRVVCGGEHRKGLILRYKSLITPVVPHSTETHNTEGSKQVATSIYQNAAPNSTCLSKFGSISSGWFPVSYNFNHGSKLTLYGYLWDFNSQ